MMNGSDSSSAMERGNVAHVNTEADQSRPEAAADQETEIDYEAEEARLQEERINYLQQQKQLADDDESIARRFQNDELLQIQRQRIQQELTDEKLARAMQEQERHSTRSRCLESTTSEADGCVINSEDLNHLNGDLALLDQQDASGGAAEEYDGVLFLGDEPDDSDLLTDQQLASALQQQEQEDALFVARSYTAENQDAYLARIMQHTERISAMRRNLNGQNVQLTTSTSSPPVSPQRAEFSTMSQSLSASHGSSPSAGGGSVAVTQHQSSPQGSLGTEVGNTEQQHEVPSVSAGDEAPLSSGTRRRRRKLSKRASCKQQ